MLRFQRKTLRNKHTRIELKRQNEANYRYFKLKIQRGRSWQIVFIDCGQRLHDHVHVEVLH
jgi:hypothetical protein